jgi:hypothetical protein
MFHSNFCFMLNADPMFSTSAVTFCQSLSLTAMSAPPMGAASSDLVAMEVDAAQPAGLVPAELVPAEDAVLKAVKDGTGQFQPPRNLQERDPELVAINKLIHHYLKKCFRYCRSLHTGYPVVITEAYDEVMLAPTLSKADITLDYFVHVAYKYCSKKDGEFQIFEEPNEGNKGYFSVQAIEGWDERNKVNRMLLQFNIAARESLMMMLSQRVPNIKLSSVVIKFDRKRRLECSGKLAAWRDWVKNLEYFPTLFECRDLQVPFDEDLPCDYLITCKQWDTLQQVANPNLDYKDWMLNSAFGLDDDGQPMDVQAIQASSWPAPGSASASPPEASASASPPGAAAPSEADKGPQQSDSWSSSGKGTDGKSWGAGWNPGNWVQFPGAGSDGKSWGQKGTDGKSWAAGWASNSR